MNMNFVQNPNSYYQNRIVRTTEMFIKELFPVLVGNDLLFVNVFKTVFENSMGYSIMEIKNKKTDS